MIRATIAGATIGALLQIGTAFAAEMTGAQIKEYISGKTVYLNTNASGSVTGSAGQGVLFYDANGTVLYKTPKGALWHGTWTIKENTACSDWKESPNNPCTKYDKTGDIVTQINAATGQPRGTIAKIADGNAEKLAP